MAVVNTFRGHNNIMYSSSTSLTHWLISVMNKKQRTRLSELIKEIRGDDSLRKLARELGVSAVAVCSWENCDSVPAFDSLDAIAKKRGWTIYELLSYLREEDMSPNTDKIFQDAMTLTAKDKIRLASLLLASNDVQA